jgi:hypothetical protein
MNLYPEYTFSITEAMDDSSSQHVCSCCIEELILQLTATQGSSRSVSPEAPKHRSASPIPELPLPVKEFFNQVSSAGFPSHKTAKAKAQPWRVHWSGPEEVPDDGKLIVACPKKCTYGTFVVKAEALLTIPRQHKSWRLLNVDGRSAWAGMHAWAFNVAGISQSVGWFCTRRHHRSCEAPLAFNLNPSMDISSDWAFVILPPKS